MKLRGIDFGNAFVASGALNFFGEGWRHQQLLKLSPGFSFKGTTFVSKTMTLNERKENLELNDKLQPKRLLPDCIRLYPMKGVILNSVGLSGPGAEYLFSKDIWQKRMGPFLISFMAVGETKADRIEEAKKFAKLLSKKLPDFVGEVGLELNISCPNTSHDPLELLDEADHQLLEFASLGIPVILKINALAPIYSVAKIARLKMCDAITVSNSIPWGQLPVSIPWRDMFGSSCSPLQHLGGGGLSGKPLLPITCDWISRARRGGVNLPIIAGGGIFKKSDVNLLQSAGANAIMIGSVAVLRPWKVKGIVKRANKVFD